jgi:protein ImuB
MYVCLWSPAWSTGGEFVAGESAPEGPTPDAVGLALVDLAPRLRIERDLIWADGGGLDAAKLAEGLVRRLAAAGAPGRAGVAAVPVAAELAARWGPGGGRAGSGRPAPFLVKERTGWGWRKGEKGNPDRSGACTSSLVVVEEGREREWLETLPISALVPEPRLAVLLDGVGIQRVGMLAALEREAVEVRLGPEAVALWRLARGDDRRLLFRPVPPGRPHGSIDFVDYVLTDPGRLLFTANALLTPVCERLAGRGEHARSLRLALPLANGEEWERTIRPARPTASRETWLRLIRGTLERLTVPDAVAGMRLEVVSAEPAAVRQGDLFDRGFATASAVEAAVARLAERQVSPVAPESSAHPLVERRGEWTAVEFHGDSPPGATAGREGSVAGLSLQLLSEPRRLLVDTVRRRDHEAPVRLRDREGWREVVVAAGPDRVSGGHWEGRAYAREYFRCVTDEGVPLWIYRDGHDGTWYLHGWWD